MRAFAAVFPKVATSGDGDWNGTMSLCGPDATRASHSAQIFGKPIHHPLVILLPQLGMRCLLKSMRTLGEPHELDLFVLALQRHKKLFFWQLRAVTVPALIGRL